MHMVGLSNCSVTELKFKVFIVFLCTSDINHSAQNIPYAKQCLCNDYT